MNKRFSDFLRNKEIEFSLCEDLSKKSYIKIGCICETVTPKNIPQLVEVLDFLRVSGEKFKLVGKLTNILLPDEQYNGIIIKTNKIADYNVAESHVDASCGVHLSNLIKRLAPFGVSLCEELSGIPGSLGGMLYSNAGAYGSEISNIFTCGRFYDFANGKIRMITKDDMKFSYRHSLMMEQGLILLDAKLRITYLAPEYIGERIASCSYRRKQSQPTEYPSLGSAFKRPKGLYAAKLIDEAGLRGFCIGGAAVSTKHAGFIINLGSATANDVISLIRVVKERVFLKFGIMLEEEIEILN